jgi:hypothetical protein
VRNIRLLKLKETFLSTIPQSSRNRPQHFFQCGSHYRVTPLSAADRGDSSITVAAAATSPTHSQCRWYVTTSFPTPGFSSRA